MTERRSHCQRAEGMLEAFLEGELSPEEQRWLSAHLEQCEGCSDELWALSLGRKAREVLVPAKDPGQALADQREWVLARIGQQAPRAKCLRFARRWWWVAASAAAIVLAALLTWPSTTPVVEQATVPVEQVTVFHVEQPAATSPKETQPEPQVKERTVTEVRFFWDGIQIVWVFDSHFKP